MPLSSLPGKRRSGLAALLAPLLLLSGLGAQDAPVPEQPAPPEPAAEAPPKEARSIRLPQGLSPDQVFGPGRRLELSLEASMRIALGNDLGLQIEEASTDLAYANARGSWGAFDWVFGVSGGITDTEVQQRTELEGADVLTVNTQSASAGLSRPLEIGGLFSVNYDRANTETNNAFAVIDPSTTDVIRLAYTQPLLRGFGTDYATSRQQEAELEYELQRERLRQARQSLLLSVSNAYWDLVLALQELDVASSSLELALEQLERDRRVFEVGLGTEVDVLQSEAQVAQRTELLLRADVAVKAAEDGLKQILFPGTEETTWETRIAPSTPLPDEVESAKLPGWTQLLVGALEQRSEVRQRNYEIQMAEITHERALSERRPQLDLALSMAGQGFSGDPAEAFESAVGFDYPTYGATLSFSSPIQNRTARWAVRAARAQIRQARLRYDQTESQIVADVRDALRQLEYAAEAVRAADRSLEAARRQLEAEQARNREGISTTFEVLQLQDQYVRAMSSERSARVSYMRARVRLQSAKGTLGEEWE